MGKKTRTLKSRKSGILRKDISKTRDMFVSITPEFIEKNVGFLNTKGKLLRALYEEKKRER